MTCRIEVVGLVVDKTKCTRCKLCIDLCPVNALHDENGLPRLSDPAKCLACIGCMAVCDYNALKLVTRWAC